MNRVYNFFSRHYLFFSGLALFFIIRIPFFLNINFEFNADEAVNGLMALHILKGKSFPIFMYGQSYMGAIEPWMAAFMFLFTGPSIFVLRLTPLLSAILMYVFVYALGCHFFKEKKFRVFLVLSSVLLPPYLLAYSLSVTAGRFFSIALGALLYFLYFKWYIPGRNNLRLIVISAVAGFAYYIDKLFLHFLMPLIILFVLKDLVEFLKREKSKVWRYYMSAFFTLAAGAFLFAFVLPKLVSPKDPFMLFGFIRFSSSRSALNLWIQLSFITILPYLIFFIRNNLALLKKTLPSVFFGFLIGYFPTIIYKLFVKEEVYGHANFYLTKNILLAFDSLLRFNFEKATFFTFYNFKTLPFYLTLIIFILIICSIPWKSINFLKPNENPVYIYLFSVLFGILSFLLSPMTDYSSFRYLGSYMVVIPLLLTIVFKRLFWIKPKISYLFFISYLALSLFQIQNYYTSKKLYTNKPVQHHLMNNNINEIRGLINVLKDRGIKYSYADYWLSYIITFLSAEEHISSPTKKQWIRIRDHLDKVSGASKKAHIYRSDEKETIPVEPGYKEVERLHVPGFFVVVVEKTS